MKCFPFKFCRWVTKQMCECNGCNRHLSRFGSRNFKNSVENKCPACRCNDESTVHITTCPDPGRLSLYDSLVAGVADWLRMNDTDPCMLRLIEAYLKGKGRTRMSDLVTPLTPPKYHLLAETQDRLGWQNFIEGRFALYYAALQREHLSNLEMWRTTDVWAKGIIEVLLRITHKQWLHRNALVHFSGEDGRTLLEKEAIAKKVEELMWTDPVELLEEDRPLLEEDCARLGATDATTQAYWIADVEAAKKTAEVMRNRRRSLGPSPGEADVNAEGHLDGGVSDIVESVPAEIDTKGSMAYRRRRKRV